ncbi:hypothetical protein BHE90_005568 [Fusarium euwallaceae]|uniref:Aminoglycoside phosphotransferase domain-containing protein n=1 Tax=Fusarium euwallaceae TaxID=1147111 RepID=A0A430LW37_9HYPO|nr:hypothetical protein BHE90_005568 [Fusarium euwallaceae]
MSSRLYPMAFPQYVHFHRTFRQVDERTWIIGGRLLISLLDSPHDRTSWPAGDDGAGWYHASIAPNPRPNSIPIHDESRFKLLTHWREEGAMWEIGKCILRVQLRVGEHDTKEADTLMALKGLVLSLETPTVYGDFEFDGYEYIIYSKIDGLPLNKVWNDLDAEHKNRCVSQIARFCKELSTWERDTAEGVGGIRGSRMRDAALLLHNWMGGNTPQAMLENCMAMGLDCSKLVFAHNFMFPHNIIFHCETGASDGCIVGIQDWTHAGFVPEGWVRAGFVLYDNNLGDEWRRLIHAALTSEHFSVPDEQPLMAWRRETAPEKSVLQSQYWATVGRERRLRAEQHILEVTKPSENPGVSDFWDGLLMEDYPHVSSPVSLMSTRSYYYPQR